MIRTNADHLLVLSDIVFVEGRRPEGKRWRVLVSGFKVLGF